MTKPPIGRAAGGWLAAFPKAPSGFQLLRRGRRETPNRGASKRVCKWTLEDCSCFSLQEAQTRHQQSIWKRCPKHREIHNV